MHKFAVNLWFDSQAQEAAEFYTSIFKHSKIKAITHYPESVSRVAQRPAGSVLTVAFEIDGQEFLALNGGPVFKFNEAISLVVYCKTQEEIDDLWTRLTKGGGEPGQCGWLKDKFGVSWQIVPAVLPELLEDKDPGKAERVGEAIMSMKKLDIKTLKQAYDSAPQGASR